METKVTTIENAPTLEVDAKSTKRTVTQGLESVSTAVNDKDRRDGFAINSYVCKRCGEQSDLSERDAQVCSWCKGKDLHQTGYTSRSKTEKIINRTLKYKCHTCGKLYDTPDARCCIAEYEIKNRLDYSKFYRGFMCLGCRKIYEQKVVCCSTAKMISGQYRAATEITRQLMGAA